MLLHLSLFRLSTKIFFSKLDEDLIKTLINEESKVMAMFLCKSIVYFKFILYCCNIVYFVILLKRAGKANATFSICDCKKINDIIQNK